MTSKKIGFNNIKFLLIFPLPVAHNCEVKKLGRYCGISNCVNNRLSKTLQSDTIREVFKETKYISTWHAALTKIGPEYSLPVCFIVFVKIKIYIYIFNY